MQTPGRRAMPMQALGRLFGPWVAEVSRATLRADLWAGLLGALLVLPQGIAFATLAGLPPQYGLYTAIIPCAVAALFGSSRHVMSGPTNANSLALYAMLAPLAVAGSGQYIELALVVTLLVGLMQWLIGALRMGALANFISPAALMGFTSGAALLIAVHALGDLLGLPPASEHGTLAALAHAGASLGDAHPGALLVGAATMAVSLAVKRWDRRKPHMLAGLAAGTALAVLVNQAAPHLGWSPIAQVGAIGDAWPRFHLPDVEWSRLPELVSLAFALTIVALGQSISIAKMLAARSGQRLDANREFRGQGLSNLVGGVFSCYVSCGSLNRSLPNLEAGARTPLAAVFSAALLMALVAVSAPLLAAIPMTAISGLLLLVAWSLLDIGRWRRLLARHRTESAIALATMAATVTIRIETAILIGTLLSLLTYLHRTSRPAMRTMGFDSRATERRLTVLDGNPPQARIECPQLKMLRMEGSIYFGATSHVGDRLHALRAAPGAPRHLLVMARSMNFIDLSGAELWDQELAERRARGGDLYFHAPRTAVIEMWTRTGFLEKLGRDHIFDSKGAAIAGIFPRLDPAICARCQVRAFRECIGAPSPDDLWHGQPASAPSAPK